jgi:ATP-dependent RNA helicase DHX37/DHR1
MGPPVRQRYNAKARQSTVGGSAHKKRRRSAVNHEDVPVETHSTEATAELDMILPGQREAERQSRLDALQREITEQGEQLSSKKRKRLDAFIVSLRLLRAHNVTC